MITRHILPTECRWRRRLTIEQTFTGLHIKAWHFWSLFQVSVFLLTHPRGWLLRKIYSSYNIKFQLFPLESVYTKIKVYFFLFPWTLQAPWFIAWCRGARDVKSGPSGNAAVASHFSPPLVSIVLQPAASREESRAVADLSLCCVDLCALKR